MVSVCKSLKSACAINTRKCVSFEQQAFFTSAGRNQQQLRLNKKVLLVLNLPEPNRFFFISQF